MGVLTTKEQEQIWEEGKTVLYSDGILFIKTQHCSTLTELCIPRDEFNSMTLILQ
jgi:hypothetical protein